MDNVNADENHFAKELQLVRDACSDLSLVASDPGEFGQVEEIFMEVLTHLSNEAFGHLLLQMIGGNIDVETGEKSRNAKLMALEVAEILGPDHAQNLYRFAVLVTKLA